MHWFQVFRPLLFPCLPHAKVQLPAQTLQLHLLAMSLGRHRALQLALLQDRMSVEEAVGAGVVAKQVPRGEALGALPDRLVWEEDPNTAYSPPTSTRKA
ncbi:enoyl-CoA hydratase [Corynebacterium striatum]|mgnify:CR=1 FL=1|nr:hypothetical protein HMPREF0308_1746 [Corynebacterium striatum ATCC 6940]KAA1265756.1 enoyl-CoA hydratase/isomerase family protein [Corynebacterium striatum]OFT49675.1 hypothetical protein HMPREF3153_11155 [Corynebacterium sp. HMSC06C06]STD34927.1 enoyl-CoA hydratase [Corynebacterium striatum]STD61424.1 enoyl-CoA hydratase [Corynebacterium striatum]